MAETTQSLQFQMYLVDAYQPLLTDLGIDTGDLQPFDLLIIHGQIAKDEEFFARTLAVRKEWEAEQPELSAVQKQIAGAYYDFPRMVAKKMSRRERADFVARLRASGIVP